MATEQRDYYEVLGVARDTDTRAIKDAFRELALKYHPDRNRSPESEPRKCTACNGSGQQVTTRQEKKEQGTVSFQQITICPVCHGQGSFIDDPCDTCEGRGEVKKEDTLKVTIPEGVDEGTALRIPGHGLPSPAPNGPPGDLYVIVRSHPDPRFERHGADLWRLETIEITDAILGDKIKAPTLDGSVEVTIQAGSQPDEVLCLKGKGLPVFGAHMRGDINIRLQVHLPEKLSAKERALYEQLRDINRKAKKSRQVD